MDTTKQVGLGLLGLSALYAYQSYDALQGLPGHPLAENESAAMKPGEPFVTPLNALSVRQAENHAFRRSLYASGFALAGLYLWMK